jgi:hypothetical protein
VRSPRNSGSEDPWIAAALFRPSVHERGCRQAVRRRPGAQIAGPSIDDSVVVLPVHNSGYLRLASSRRSGGLTERAQVAAKGCLWPVSILRLQALRGVLQLLR